MTQNTRDLSLFGFRELRIATELLTAYVDSNKRPDDFEGDGVTLEFNPNSGNVFLVNDEFQVAMMNGDKLEQFHSCPYCGAEGFKDEIHEGETPDDMNAECVRYLKDIGIDDERTAGADDDPEEAE